MTDDDDAAAGVGYTLLGVLFFIVVPLVLLVWSICCCRHNRCVSPFDASTYKSPGRLPPAQVQMYVQMPQQGQPSYPIYQASGNQENYPQTLSDAPSTSIPNTSIPTDGLVSTSYQPPTQSERKPIDESWTGSRYSQDLQNEWLLGTTISYQEIKRITGDFAASNKIGGGGSCSVYKAVVDKCKCAVKRLDVAADVHHKKQFAAEIQTLTRIKHINICRLFAVSDDGPRTCLVLERMNGSLENRLLRTPQLSCLQVTKWMV
jgi:hypothetical protein